MRQRKAWVFFVLAAILIVKEMPPMFRKPAASLPRLVVTLLLALASQCAGAQQAWPVRPVRVIATSPPGGSVDLLARILADEFTRSFGKPFVVENRPGANGNIGVDAVVKAPPDGYMLFVTIPGVFSINTHLHEKMPFDPKTELAPVAMLGYSPLLLVIHPSVPARTWGELRTWLEARPGKVSYSSAGVGTTGHVGMELLKSMTGIDVVHVPYKGAAAATTDLLSGNVLLTLNNTSASVPHIQRGQMKAIAVAEKYRIPSLPEVPTLNESGVQKKRPPKHPPKPLRIPPALTLALKKNKKARAAFDAFPPSHKRDYADWIADAKAEDTRNRRLAQAITWIAEGKSRNWKYERRG